MQQRLQQQSQIRIDLKKKIKVLLTFTLHIPVNELLEKLMLKYDEEFKGALSIRLHTDTCDYE